MDARERWQALQRSLSAARRFLEIGDRDRALAAVDAALGIDPEFLAAQALRERILAVASTRDVAPLEDSGLNDPPLRSATTRDATPVDLPLRPATGEPSLAPTGYAKFEQRAKRRRVDHRLDAARAAIENGRMHDAASALNEVLELDPNAPELPSLTASFDRLRRAGRAPRRGPWLAAAAVFGATLFGASWLEKQQLLLSRPLEAVSSLVAVSPPVALSASSAAGDSEPASIGTSGLISHLPSGPDAIATMSQHAVPVPRIAPPEPPLQLQPLPNSTPSPAAAEPAPPPAEPQPSAPPSVPLPPVTRVAASPAPAVDETGRVQQALQRYRVAYNGLDAGSAQAVWPAVDEDALARAFEGLESQTLTFDACDVQLQNETATATCRGSARYVPKVGSRDPRTEPRVWTFVLRKSGSDWKIDTARVER